MNEPGVNRNEANSEEPNDNGVNRRQFLDVALGVGGLAFLASVIYPISKYIVPPEVAEADPKTVNVGKVDDFKPDTGTIFKMGSKPGLLVRTKEGEFKAFTAICTHLSCTVQYRPDMGLIWCACHNGRYDLSGSNVAGPPPRPLNTMKVDIRDGQVYVSKEEA